MGGEGDAQEGAAEVGFALLPCAVLFHRDIVAVAGEQEFAAGQLAANAAIFLFFR